MSLRSRGDQVSSTHPEPPPCALPMAVNSARQRSTLSKSRASASRSSPSGALSSPSEAKKKLVQDHRVAGDQLLALETVDHEAGGFCEIQLGELGGDRIEAIDRAPVIILVMA